MNAVIDQPSTAYAQRIYQSVLRLPLEKQAQVVGYVDALAADDPNFSDVLTPTELAAMDAADIATYHDRKDEPLHTLADVLAEAGLTA